MKKIDTKEQKLIEINKNWRPRWWQWYAMKTIAENHEVTLTVARQNGKTEVLTQIIMDFMFHYNHVVNPRCLVVSTTLEQAQKLLFERSMKFLKDLPENVLIRRKSNNAVSLVLHRPWFNDYVTIQFSGAGNPDSIRGETNQLAIVDEAAFIEKNTILRTIAPTLDDNKQFSKLILSSTVKGFNHYTDICDAYAQPDPVDSLIKTANIEFTDVNAHCRSLPFILDKMRIALATNDMPGYRQEYRNDRYALASDKAPFLKYAATKKFEKIEHTHNIFAVYDRGSEGSHATIEVGFHDQPFIYDASIKYKNKFDMIDCLIRKYNGLITVICPWDEIGKAEDETKTRFEKFEEYINEKGYGKRVKLVKTPKTISREVLVQEGIDLLKTDIKFNFTPGISDLLAGLRKIEFKKDSVKDFVKNGSQHWGDAWCYFSQAIAAGRIYRISYNKIIEQPSVMTYEGF